MKPYLENRNGEHFEFSKLSRSKKILILDLYQEANETEKQSEKFAKFEDICFTILRASYPELTREQFTDILDYNDEVYGFDQLYELLGDAINYVFTQKDGEKKTHPYLAEAKKEETTTETIETAVVENNPTTY